MENGKKYFSVASGGGTGRTLHPDNVAAGPASYGMTDTMGRMHSDAQFAGSSSVPAHVEMMGLIGMGNNPMVGATVALRRCGKSGKVIAPCVKRRMSAKFLWQHLPQSQLNFGNF